MTNIDELRGHSLAPEPDLLRKIPRLYATDGVLLPLKTVWVHYFIAPATDWYLMELDPTESIAFGWVCLNGDKQNAELGYFNLRELSDLLVPSRNGLPVYVERDLYWTPCPYGELPTSGE